MDRDAQPFRSLVFAGGGGRCLWQVGFLEVASPELGLDRVREVAAVSAGAAMACLVFGGVGSRGVEDFRRRAAANPSNFHGRNLLRGRSPFPHAAIYRQAILDLVDASVLTRLHAGPDLRIHLARPPARLGPRASLALGLGAYLVERRVHDGPHSRLARRMGFTLEGVPVRACRTPAELADLILQSSCTPPFTPAMLRDGAPVLDGGVVDAVPVEGVGPDNAPTLVLLTRRHPEASLPRVAGRVYVMPSRPIEIAKWDYANPGAVQAAYDLGRRDGAEFVRAFRACQSSADMLVRSSTDSIS